MCVCVRVRVITEPSLGLILLPFADLVECLAVRPFSPFIIALILRGDSPQGKPIPSLSSRLSWCTWYTGWLIGMVQHHVGYKFPGFDITFGN